MMSGSQWLRVGRTEAIIGAGEAVGMARFGERQVVVGALLGVGLAAVMFAASTGPGLPAPGWVLVGLGVVSVAVMVTAVRMLWVQSGSDRSRGWVLGLGIGSTLLVLGAGLSAVSQQQHRVHMEARLRQIASTTD